MTNLPASSTPIIFMKGLLDCIIISLVRGKKISFVEVTPTFFTFLVFLPFFLLAFFLESTGGATDTTDCDDDDVFLPLLPFLLADTTTSAAVVNLLFLVMVVVILSIVYLDPFVIKFLDAKRGLLRSLHRFVIIVMTLMKVGIQFVRINSNRQ